MLSVLLIDDEEAITEVTRLFLERFGEMVVTTSSSATEAMRKLPGHSFDAIVLDYDLPGINGLEFLKIIRARGDTTPVIIFTGAGREHAAIEALNNGASYFLQKGDEPNNQLRTLVHMVRQAVDRRFVGTGLGTAQKILADAVMFFPIPSFAIDRDGRVVGWNDAMAVFSGLLPAEIMGKKEGEYSIPFFGIKTPMLVDLIFKDEAEIKKHNYTLTFRDKTTVIGWTRLNPRNGMPAVLWMKASALFDSKGVFVGAIASVRDCADEVGDTPAPVTASASALPDPAGASSGGMFNKLLGKAKGLHKEGLRLSYREGRYQDAIALFEKAIEIDPDMPFAWHDRGVCFRETGREDDALRSFDKAAELAPDEEEILYSRAGMLRKIGLLRQQPAVIDRAIRVYNHLLEVNPGYADAWNDLAICVRELGKEELSRQYFERSRKLVAQGKDRKNVRKLDRLF